ncbi:MAG: UDP-N-acetylmuramoylalanine--D-glutamate ligase [Ignavibacteria bacterium RIFCSPLOWO2_02_FULL_55_14]|nr:MAG: UDP-N-acetylmuramoylalanine--D-glutamate ligase [Ignavibacteria bacterium RIFCSPLOWO2_02_FULL_55_14]
MTLEQLSGAKVTVIGAARSGLAAAELLKAHGAVPFVSDQSSREKLERGVRELTAAGIPFETGGHTQRTYDCSLMVISPGVPSDAPVVLEAQQRGTEIVSEVELASWFCPGSIVAITGSNGKTTTTTLTGRVLGDAKTKHVVAGNIGTAFSGVVLDLAQKDIAVLEVSSFQLDHCKTFRPKVSVLLNITQDHMDRYGHSMERYAASKARVFMNQEGEDALVYCADDPWTMKVVPEARCRKVPFGLQQPAGDGAWVQDGTLVTRLNGVEHKVIAISEISIPGVHNLYNSMAASLTGRLFGVGPASIRSTLRNFPGVEHRLEYVRNAAGVRYYNDSKATNVDSVWYALQAFHDPIVLLLGGRDKGNDYTRLLDLVRLRVKAIIAIGESAGTVENAFAGITSTHAARTMPEAVAAARDAAVAGDVVLLSPACASFDWFDNYEHRGKVFKELVNRL